MGEAQVSVELLHWRTMVDVNGMRSVFEAQVLVGGERKFVRSFMPIPSGSSMTDGRALSLAMTLKFHDCLPPLEAQK